MSKTSTNIYQTSRISTKRTQADAAAFLGISERTLAAYEAGDSPVPDDIAAAMVRLYQDSFLAYQHLLQHNMAKDILPTVEVLPLANAALQLMSVAEQYISIQSKMVDVCKDSKISDDELPKMAEVEHTVRELIAAAYTFLYADKGH